MFRVGDNVMYGVHGACKIAASEMRRVDRKNLTYLVLEPLDHGSSRYYVPVHNQAAMGKLRSVLSRQELEQLLESETTRQNSWISDENRRKQVYKELLSGGSREELVRMLYSVYCQREMLSESGRKLHLCDDNFLRDAEKVIIGEIVASLEMPPEDARLLLRRKLGAM